MIHSSVRVMTKKLLEQSCWNLLSVLIAILNTLEIESSEQSRVVTAKPERLLVSRIISKVEETIAIKQYLFC